MYKVFFENDCLQKIAIENISTTHNEKHERRLFN